MMNDIKEHEQLQSGMKQLSLNDQSESQEYEQSEMFDYVDSDFNNDEYSKRDRTPKYIPIRIL